MQEKKRKKSTNNDTFGKRLHKLRKSKGLSQSQLAGLLGYKRSGSVSNLENDKTTPDIATLGKLAQCLDADLHWLITGKPSELVETLRIYTSSYIANIYDEIAGLRKHRAELALLQSMGHDHKKELSELDGRVEELCKHGETLRQHLNSFLDPMGRGF